LHFRLQHFDVAPGLGKGNAALSARAAAVEPLEPARRDQGLLRRRTERDREAAHDPEGDGTDRNPDDSPSSDRQSSGGLESIYEPSDGCRGTRLRRRRREAKGEVNLT